MLNCFQPSLRDGTQERSADLPVCRFAGFPACGCRMIRGALKMLTRRRLECRRYGRLESLCYGTSMFQSSLRDLSHLGAQPTVETVGYYQLSLRDKNLRAIRC